MDYIIRSAVLEDRKWIERLYRQSKDEVGIFNPWMIWQKHINKQGSGTFIVIDQIAVVYYYHSSKQRCIVLSDIVVDSEHRNKGIGKVMVNYLIKKARTMGIALTCKSKITNPNAQFWSQMGFQKVGQALNASGELHDVWIIT
jgi:N-acetylglutamate synthase-like GNAT family acetyltransferase